MKIKLRRTGGFIPVTKTAETEVNLTDKEVVQLLEVIQPDPAAYRIKDGTYYEVTIGTRSSAVDLNKVPEEFRELFSKLKEDLKIIK
jgi:hypothetical protein